MDQCKDGQTKKPRKSITESNVVRSILSGLELKYPSAFDRVNTVAIYDKARDCYKKPSRFYRPGMSDIIGCLKGRFVAIEIKTPKEYTYYTNLMSKIGDINTFVPKNKKEAHALRQFRYMANKTKVGALCFLTYSLDHTLKILEDNI